MAAELSLLNPGFGALCKTLLETCSQHGAEMRPNEGVRDPWQQARYWRQSRSKEEITAAIARLNNSGANYIAEILDEVGAQHGDPVTNALPGASWHQWGLALDCFWLVGGVAEWSTSRTVNGINGYRLYADQAEQLDLTAGGRWRSIKDWPHVQAKGPVSPLNKFTWAEINDEMVRLYPRNP
ncbi:D-alanyl-D-alanine carboxypeptidase [Kaistia soli DSM 19436]|uniref:D-alanyl-D-alanine carboxypeptidase n=1 Tax=Kaistia soli DSM 19436 TaxID=1122133 RepID=A0A1M5PAH8_9HYPH|nr:M15 family metallopeptidase [Kaistia soli]SHG98687.1 D-alanyl-D-alanine carboxypeptidase [Kaistia soli DSM 19436]